MIWLYIILSILLLILILIIIYFIIFFYIKKRHELLFNKRVDVNKLINSYTFDEFNINNKRYEINYNAEKIISYLYTKDIIYEDKLIIFCHGYGSTKESYCQDIAYYADNGFKVLAYECVGTGESSGVIGGIGNSLKSLKIVIDYIKTLDEFKNLDIYVIGHSFGGYATLNIINYYKDIKGICAIAPIVGLKPFSKKYNKSKLFEFMLTKIDKSKCGEFSLYNGLDSINKYNGKILLIQSKNDNVVPFDSSIGYIKDNTKNKNVEYIINDNRYHNPYYLEEATNKLYNFLSSLNDIKEDDLIEYFKKQDFRSMGALDLDIMNQIKEWILK